MKNRTVVAMVMAAILAFSGQAMALSLLDVGGADQLDFGMELDNSGKQLADLGYAYDVPNSGGAYWVQLGEPNSNLWAYYFGGSSPDAFVVKTGSNTFNYQLSPDGPYDAFFYTNETSKLYAVINLADYYDLTGNPDNPHSKVEQNEITISRVSHVNSTKVPEPGTLLLLGCGLLGVGLMRRRRD